MSFRVLLIIFGFLVGIIGFCESLLLDNEREQLRTRLAIWYSRIGKPGWHGVLPWALQAVRTFLDRTFGKSLISTRVLVISAIVVALWTWLAFHHSMGLTASSLSDLDIRHFPYEYGIPSFFGEVSAIVALRYGLKALEVKHVVNWIFVFSVCIIAAYLGSSVSSLFFFLLEGGGVSGVVGAAPGWLKVFALIASSFATPMESFLDSGRLSLEQFWAIPPMLTSISILAIFLSLWLVVITRPFTQATALRIVHRLSKLRPLVIAGLAALVIGMIALLLAL